MKMYIISICDDPRAVMKWFGAAGDTFEMQVVNQFDYRTVDRAHALASIDQDVFLSRFGSLPTSGAIGCALAHRYCLEDMIKNGAEVAVIFEDDAALSPQSVANIIAALSRSSDFDVLVLGSLNAVVSRHSALTIGDVAYHRCWWFCHGAYAYIVSRSGAQKILSKQSPRLTAYSDYPVHAWQMRLFLAVPGVVDIYDHISATQPIHIHRTSSDQSPSLRQKIYHRVRRAIWLIIGGFRKRLFGDMTITGTGIPDIRKF